MSEFKFNYDFLKKNATSGSWRRGYEYYQKDMILEAYPEKNFFKGKVKGNYQDFYVTDLIFKKNKIEARCNCPLKEEWCKHAVAIGLKAIETGAYDDFAYDKFGIMPDVSDMDTALKAPARGSYIFHFNPKEGKTFFLFL